MQPSYLAPLGPAHQEYRLSFSNHHIYLQIDAEVERNQEAGGAAEEEAPLIENYYCFKKDGDLVKVTLVKIGGEVLRLTDRITVRRDVKTEEDEKTKCGANNSPIESYSQRQVHSKKTFLSKTAKTLLKTFEEWINQNQPESLKYIYGINQEYASQAHIINTFAYNSNLRQGFLDFHFWLSQQPSLKRLARLGNAWRKRCLLAREDERAKEEYIEEILQKM